MPKHNPDTGHAEHDRILDANGAILDIIERQDCPPDYMDRVNQIRAPILNEFDGAHLPDPSDYEQMLEQLAGWRFIGWTRDRRELVQWSDRIPLRRDPNQGVRLFDVVDVQHLAKADAEEARKLIGDPGWYVSADAGDEEILDMAQRMVCRLALDYHCCVSTDDMATALTQP